MKSLELQSSKKWSKAHSIKRLSNVHYTHKNSSPKEQLSMLSIKPIKKRYWVSRASTFSYNAILQRYSYSKVARSSIIRYLKMRNIGRIQRQAKLVELSIILSNIWTSYYQKNSTKKSQSTSVIKHGSSLWIMPKRLKKNLKIMRLFQRSYIREKALEISQTR